MGVDDLPSERVAMKAWVASSVPPCTGGRVNRAPRLVWMRKTWMVRWNGWQAPPGTSNFYVTRSRSTFG